MAKKFPKTINNSEQLYNSICRIYEEKNNKNGTGFFMQISLDNTYYFLITCSSIISNENLDNKDTIVIFFTSNKKEEKRYIKIDKRSRFIFFKPFYITLIEIDDSDNIPKDIFLCPDLKYKKKFSFYLNKSYYIAGFENNNNKYQKFISSFDINDLFGYEFNHNVNKGPEALGSIICSKDNLKVIGINIRDNNNNYGVFIGKILDHLENSRIGIDVKYDINMYKGTFNYGLRHGKGSCFYIDGGLYEGDWVNDSREGEGIMFYSNGNIYSGSWKNDRREGYGSFYFCTGGTYKGEFKNNIIDGFGELKSADNLTFVGTLSIACLDNLNFNVSDFLNHYI